MALLADPRVFVIPTFRFEKDGTFALGGAVARPHPEEIFECKRIELKAALRSSPWRKDAEAGRITFGSDEKSVTFVSSTSEEVPLFWHYELIDEYGRPAAEADYQALWQLRKSEHLAYFSFAQKGLSLALHTEGRLLEIVVYLLFFEAEEGCVGAMREWLEEQALKEVVAEHRQELSTAIIADLRGRGLTKQLAKKYPAAAATLACLA